MIRSFCDSCGQELLESNACNNTARRSSLISVDDSKVQVDIITGLKQGMGLAWNGGDFCKYCVIDSVNLLDDRVYSTSNPAAFKGLDATLTDQTLAEIVKASPAPVSP